MGVVLERQEKEGLRVVGGLMRGGREGMEGCCWIQSKIVNEKS